MSNRILSYKGKLVNGGQDTILLSTRKGETGYRIRKFQAMGTSEDENYEATIKLYSTFQSTVNISVDFSDTSLLGAILYGDQNSPATAAIQTIVFDQVIFNQDIYVTFDAASASADMNYYLELEMISLTEDQAMVATLSDIRTNS
jgi:hypothetical protein